MYDGSISFSTALDNKQLEKELAGLTKKIDKKTQDIAKLTEKRDAVKKNGLFDGSVLDAEKEKLREMQDRLDDLRASVKDRSLTPTQRNEAKDLIPSLQEEIADQKTHVRGLQAEWDKLQNAAERYDTQIEEATAELEKQKRTAGQIQEKLDENAGAGAQERMAAYLEKNSFIYQKLSSVLGKTSDASAILKSLAEVTGGGKLSGAFQAASEAISNFGMTLSGVVSKAAPFLAVATVIFGLLKKLWKAASDFSAGFANALKRGASTVYSFSSSVAKNFVATLKSIGKLSTSFVKTVTGITKSIIELAKRINVISRLTETLGSAFKRMGQMIRRVFVFSVITSGLRMIREQVSAYLMVNEQFSTALRRLQGALLTAFQPIYEVVVPALTTMVNVLTHTLAVLAQFFAGLFGTTAKKAQANAKALYDEAKALKATGKAADEAAGSVAGFDEINPIQTEDKSGNGNGGTTDTGALFDYDYEETPFASWGEAFDAFLDNLLGGIPKLEAAFKQFADSLNNWSQKLYDMFTFPGVLDKVKQLGEELADALNDLVNWIDWELLGRALSAGLNLALNSLTSFLYEFDWIALGKRLANFVNGLAAKIDWYEFGRLLWAGFKIGLETFAGFITSLDMPQLALAASNIIIGFFTEMKNTIDLIPWHEIGAQIAIFLNEIDWYGIITSTADAIKAALGAAVILILDFIITMEWGKIAEQIYTAINDSLNLINLDGIGWTIGQAFIHVFDFVLDIVASIEWYQIGQNIAYLILSFDFASALGSLGDLIAAGLNTAIQLAHGLMDNIMPEAQSIAEDIAERLKNAVKTVEWDTLGGVIGDAIKTALSFVAGLLTPELFYEIGKSIGDFLINLDWVSIIGGLTEVLVNGIKSAVATVSGFLNSVQPNLQEIAEGIAQKINEFVNEVDWAELGSTIHDGIEAAIYFLLTILDQLDWDAIGDAISDFLTNLNWPELMSKWAKVFNKAINSTIKGIDLSDLLWLGGQMVSGMVTGWVNKWTSYGGISGWLKHILFEPFIDAFQSLFGIASPSKVMAEQGDYLIAGLLQGISETWNSIVEFFSEKVDALKRTLSEAWENIKTTASTTWGNIKTSLTTTWDNIRSIAVSKFEGIKNSISGIWRGLVSSASSWGRDICSNIANGISRAIGTVTSAVSSVANKISSFLHFSEPDVGPLSNFHTYMPDMLKLMAEGILDNTDLAVNAASKLADSVANTLSGKSISINVSAMPDFSNYSVPNIARGAVVPSNREFMSVLVDQDSKADPWTGPETGNDEIITLLQAILGAVKDGHIILVNEDVLGRTTQKSLNNITTKTGKFALNF